MKTEASKIKSLLMAQLPQLQKKFPIAKMALFGSVVREDFDSERSDIDIMVEFNGNIGWEFIDLSDELEKLSGKKVDLVSRGGIKPRYWEYIKRIFYMSERVPRVIIEDIVESIGKIITYT